MSDDRYIVGIRPHHLTLNGSKPDCVRVNGTVIVAEISGSESVIHVNVEENSWVSESHGVHPFEVGDSAMLSIDIDRCLYFAGDGTRLAS